MRALRIILRHIPQSHASHLRTAWSVFTSPENGKAVRHQEKRLADKRPANLLDYEVSSFVCVVFSHQRRVRPLKHPEVTMFVLWLLHFYKRQYDAFGNARPPVNPTRDQLYSFFCLLLTPEAVMTALYDSEASRTYY